jgi:hypothetical protein
MRRDVGMNLSNDLPVLVRSRKYADIRGSSTA